MIDIHSFFPGHLRRAAFAILAMFIISLQSVFHNNVDSVEICISLFTSTLSWVSIFLSCPYFDLGKPSFEEEKNYISYEKVWILTFKCALTLAEHSLIMSSSTIACSQFANRNSWEPRLIPYLIFVIVKFFELEHKRIALHSKKYWNNYETKNWEMAVIFDLMESCWIGISTNMAEATIF